MAESVDAGYSATSKNSYRHRTFWLKHLHRWHWISAALCLAGLLLFAITGFTLNHASWIASTPRVTTTTLELPAKLLAAVQDAAVGSPDPATPVPQELARWLSDRLDVRLAHRQVEWSAQEIYVSLPRPGGDAWLTLHLSLTPPAGQPAHWDAGDIAVIDPHNSTWNDAPPLPHREYSIASLPQDGSLHLLVRRIFDAQGMPGLGSDWLTRRAQPGDTIALRIRVNSNFHAPAEDRPLILIGNGTGIAGLRALLKARVLAGHLRNWLLFGERHAIRDNFYGEDLQRWRDQGYIDPLDLVFSREPPERRYVQHRLLECATLLRRWVAQGAAIYVCGSQDGMAPGVDAALTRILGAAALADLREGGRYRHDVY